MWFLNIECLIDEDIADAEDRDLFWYAETDDDIWQRNIDWYIINGTPLF